LESQISEMPPMPSSQRPQPGSGCSPVLIIVFLGIWMSLSANPVSARELDDPEQPSIHWAFANQLGTGIYQIGENNQIYILQVKPRFHLDLTPGRSDPARHLLLEFSLPLSIGVHTFKWGDLLQGKYPDRLRQLSFAPGVALEIPVSRIWTLRPQLHVGWGTLLGDEKERAWIFGLDLKSRLQFTVGRYDLFLLNGLALYGHTSNLEKSEDILAVINGLEGHIPLGSLKFRDNPLYLKAHLINTWFVEEIEYLFHADEDPINLGMNWEIGLAIGAKKRIRLWIFSLDRAGVSFSLGKMHRGIVIFFSSRFFR